MNVGARKRVSERLMKMLHMRYGTWREIVNAPQYQSGSQNRPIEYQDQNFEGENRLSHVFVDDFLVDQDWLALSHILMSAEEVSTQYKPRMINCKAYFGHQFDTMPLSQTCSG
jgi:hypothetical protein